MDQPVKDEAAKERIIKHMNLDHRDSLIRYLEHFCQLSSFSARNARLKSVSLDSLSILTGDGKEHLVPIQPTMSAWSEARARFADLDTQAVKGLGRSSITVKKYARPRGFLAVVFVTCTLTYIAYSRRSNFQPGSLLYDILLRHTDAFARFCYKIQPFLLYPMVVLHLGEAVYMARTRLRKHSVPTFSKLWWIWVASTFIEGVGAFIRIDEMVREEEEKKASAKH